MANVPPLWQISSNTNSICNIGTACAIFVGRGGGGGRNPIYGNFYHMVFYPGGGEEIHGGESYVTPDSPYSGNMMYPQQKIHSIQL